MRDNESYYVALFALYTFEKVVLEWRLHKNIKPSSPYFIDYKKTKARYKKLPHEKKQCKNGITFILFGECLKEKIHVAQPITGAKEKAPKSDNTPSAIYLRRTFNAEFESNFNSEKFSKKYNMESLTQDKSLKLDLDILRLEQAKLLDGNSENESHESLVKGRTLFRRNKRGKNKSSDTLQIVTEDVAPGLPIATPVKMISSEFGNTDLKLKRKLCRIYRVRCDHHGLFRAIAISQAKGKISVHQESTSIFKLRELVCKELLKNAEEPYMTDGTTVKQEMLRKSNLKVEEVGVKNVVMEYYRKMQLRKKAGVLELWGLARALKKTITVYEKVITPENSDKKYADFFKHSASYGVEFEEELLLYKNGKGEYASLLLLEQDTENNAINEEDQENGSSQTEEEDNREVPEEVPLKEDAASDSREELNQSLNIDEI